MKKSLFEQYSDIDPDFKEEINSLPQELSGRFEKRFKAEHNKTNFLSYLSEFRFVQFFILEGLNFNYDTLYENKKPDIRIKLAHYDIIAEIKRFNLSEKDQEKEDFFYRLAKSLKTIYKPYLVRIRQKKYFDYKSTDVDSIKKKFENWLKNNVKVGDIFSYKDLFIIEIGKLKGVENQIRSTVIPLNHKINPNKRLNVVIEKINTYEEITINKGVPLIVCIDLGFETLNDPSDFKLTYLGDSTESFIKGKFQTDEKIGKINGLLIKYASEFYWFQNPRQPELLTFKTITKDEK